MLAGLMSSPRGVWVVPAHVTLNLHNHERCCHSRGRLSNSTCTQTAFLLSCSVGCKRCLDLLQVRDRIHILAPANISRRLDRPFARLGIFPMGGRSTAIKLRQGGVWVLASTPLTQDTRNKIDELGEVKWASSSLVRADLHPNLQDTS